MSRTLPPGHRLGTYVVQDLIGSGGMGDVYRALDPRLDRLVALKVLPITAVANPLALARFQREARTLAALSHPNIVVLHDIGEEGGRPYTVSELLVGETLRERLDRGPMSWREALPVALDICAGLGTAHAQQVVHRDLKPENLMLTDDGRTKILDFGLAFFQNVERSADPSDTRSDTVPGSLVGTSGYMSPEQITGEETDHRTDLFSLGCVLYETLTSRKPFIGKSMVEAVTATVRDEPEPMTVSVGELPPALPQIVGRCLVKDRQLRYQSVEELAGDLRQVVESYSDLGSVAVPVVPKTSDPGTAVASSSPTYVVSSSEARRDTRTAIRSIAVLPLGGSASPDSEYLNDGLAEGLIRDLSRFEGVRVLAWSSVMRFRGAEDPLAAARKLNVDAFLTGWVREENDRLMVSMELVRCPDGDLLWGDRFTRPLDEAFAIERQISTALSTHLRSHIATRAFSGPETSSSEAYRAYLRGRYFWNQRSEQGLQRSREQFRQALEHDPLYARAWAGLADTYNVLPFWGLSSPDEAFPKAQEASARAIELYSNLAEAHASRAYAQFYFEWRWQAAETSFRTALQLDHNYATAHHWFGVCSGLRGDFDLARRELGLAAELDPLSMITAADTGLVHYWQGDLDTARRCCRSALEIDDGFAPAHLYSGLIEEKAGNTSAAVASLRRAVERSRGGTSATAALGHALARAGEVEEASTLLDRLTAPNQARYVSCYPIAVLCFGLGRVDEALDWLHRALASRSETLVWLEVDPRLDPLRKDLRFSELKRQMKAASA
ncbi:MAG: protein kinase [Thermoanaerobaculia bacterium]|nr:protein kinase [Thermoanaerobaculia bacterium]